MTESLTLLSIFAFVFSIGQIARMFVNKKLNLIHIIGLSCAFFAADYLYLAFVQNLPSLNAFVKALGLTLIGIIAGIFFLGF